MVLATRACPPSCDVVTSTVRCALSGRLLDKCNVRDTPDRVLFRELLAPTDSVVEPVVPDAVKLVTETAPDVCGLHSPPLIVAESGVRKFWQRPVEAWVVPRPRPGGP